MSSSTRGRLIAAPTGCGAAGGALWESVVRYGRPSRPPLRHAPGFVVGAGFIPARRPPLEGRWQAVGLTERCCRQLRFPQGFCTTRLRSHLSVMAPCAMTAPLKGSPLRRVSTSLLQIAAAVRTRNARPYLFTIHDYLFTHKKEPICENRSVLFCVGVTYLPVQSPAKYCRRR